MQPIFVVYSRVYVSKPRDNTFADFLSIKNTHLSKAFSTPFLKKDVASLDIQAHLLRRYLST